MILAANSYSAAEHAAAKGFINPELLPLIKAEKKADETKTNVVEKLIEEELNKLE